MSETWCKTASETSGLVSSKFYNKLSDCCLFYENFQKSLVFGNIFRFLPIFGNLSAPSRRRRQALELGEGRPKSLEKDGRRVWRKKAQFGLLL